MKGLVYVSDALHPFTLLDLEALAAQASKKNFEIGITGYLYYEKGRFLQYIEGEEMILERLMSKIEKDPRHRVINKTIDPLVQKRRFPSWGMQWIQKKNLIEVRIEYFLTNTLLFSKHNDTDEEEWKTATWNMVNKLAELQASIDFA